MLRGYDSARWTRNAATLCVRMSSMILQTVGRVVMWYVRRACHRYVYMNNRSPQCPEGEVCTAGVCQEAACPPDQTDYDGVCADLTTDPNNCGTCGTVVSSHPCLVCFESSPVP
jgi:hypothetical protein